MEDPNPNPRSLDPTETDLVQRLDDKLFIGEKPFLKQFRDFDLDQDGYVSNNDIRNFLVKNNWIKQDDVEKFISYVDPAHAGVVPFREFHKKIRRNMANWDENLEQKVRNIMQPSGDHARERTKDIPMLSQTLGTLKAKFRPDTTPNYGRRLVTQIPSRRQGTLTLLPGETRSLTSSIRRATVRCTCQMLRD